MVIRQGEVFLDRSLVFLYRRSVHSPNSCYRLILSLGLTILLGGGCVADEADEAPTAFNKDIRIAEDTQGGFEDSAQDTQDAPKLGEPITYTNSCRSGVFMGLGSCHRYCNLDGKCLDYTLRWHCYAHNYEHWRVYNPWGYSDYYVPRLSENGWVYVCSNNNMQNGDCPSFCW
jgi:hypothetical protein